MKRLATVALITGLLLALLLGGRAEARPQDGHLTGSGHWVELPGTGRSWYGAQHLGGLTAYCADLMSASPRTASGWAEAPMGAPVPKQTGQATQGHVAYGNGAARVSAKEMAELSWALTRTGQSPSADVGAAVEHFVRVRTIDGSEQRDREAVRWAAVAKRHPTAGMEFERLSADAGRYAGPYSGTLTWAKRPTSADPTGRLMVEVRSHAGRSVPHLPVEVRASGALTISRTDGSTGAEGLALVDVTMARPGADPAAGAVEVTVSDLPGAAPRVFLPAERAVQRLMVAPATTSLTLSAGTSVEPRFTPRITTRTRDVVALAGEPAVDVVTVAQGRPGAEFSGTSTLYGPYPSLDALTSDGPAPHREVGTAEFAGVYGADGGAEVTTTALTFPGPGYYTWVESLAPAEFVTPPKAAPWPQRPETSIALEPAVATRLTPNGSAEAGVRVSDAITLSGVPGREVPDGTGLRVTATGRLAGPLPPVAGKGGGSTCDGLDWRRAETLARYEDVELPEDTLAGLAPATLHEPGCYSAEATVTIHHESRDAIVVEHALGHPDQTILVTAPPAPLPSPSPEPAPAASPEPTARPTVKPTPSATPTTARATIRASAPAKASPQPGLPSTGQ